MVSIELRKAIELAVNDLGGNQEEIEMWKEKCGKNKKVMRLVCHLLLNEYHDALNSLRTLSVEGTELENVINFVSALVYIKTNNFIGGRNCLNKVDESCEFYQYKFKLLTNCEILTGNIETALTMLKDQNQPESLLKAVFCHGLKGEIEKSFEVCNTLLQQTSDFSIHCKIWKSIHKKNFQKLLNFIENMNEPNVFEIDLMYIKSLCLLNLKKYHEGIFLLNKLIQNENTEEDYWILLGNAYGEIGLLQESLWCFLKASEISPKKSEIWYNLSILYGKSSQSHESKVLLNKAKSLKLIDPVPQDFLFPIFDISTLGKKKGKFIENNPLSPEIIQPKPFKSFLNISVSEAACIQTLVELPVKRSKRESKTLKNPKV